jgi:hypothetical protein
MALEPRDRTARDGLPGLRQQAGLAHAGLADDGHDLTPALQHRVQAAREQCQLLVSSREGRDAAGEDEARTLGAGEAVDFGGRLSHRERQQVEPPLQQACRGRGHRDGAGGGRVSRGGQQPPRVARVGVVGQQAGPAAVEDALRDVDADAQRPAPAEIALREPFDGQGGERGAPGRVFDGLDSEHSHDLGRRGLFHAPPEAGHLFRD